MWAFFFVVMGLLVGIVYDVLSQIKGIGYLKWYIIWGVLLVGAVVKHTRKEAEVGKELHVHHYCIGFVLMTFICYQDPFLSVVHGFFNGMFLEGGCRWGYDPIWEYPSSSEELSEDKLVKTNRHNYRQRAAWITLRNEQSLRREQNNKLWNANIPSAKQS